MIWEFCFSNFTEGLRTLFEATCPWLYKIAKSDPHEYKYVKIFLGFLIGLGLSVAFYFAIGISMPFREREIRIVGLVIAVIVSVGFAFSVQVRCIICLTLPIFFGKHGRSIIATMAFSYLLAGPIANITINAKETGRSITCTTTLTFNHTEQLMELIGQPMAGAAGSMKGESQKAEKMGKELTDKFEPFKKEIEGEDNDNDANEDDSHKSYFHHPNQKYQEKLDYRCEDVFSKGVQHCKNQFKKTERKCRNKLPIVVKDLLCWPMKLKFFCDFLGEFDFLCDTLGINTINNEYGDVYKSVKEAIDGMDKHFEVKFDYQVIKAKAPLDIKIAKDVELNFALEMRSKIRWVKVVIQVLEALAAFLFVLVFWRAYGYSKKYMADIKFDNIYLTPYFTRIDERRMLKGKRTILPFKRAEKKAVIPAFQSSLTPEERKAFITGMLLLLVNVLVCATVFMIDDLFFQTLQIIWTHSEVNYRLEGQHSVTFTVEGSGVVANLVRTILTSFQYSRRLESVSTNFHCLAVPTQLAKHYLVEVFALWAVFVVMLYLQAYAMRFRRVICSFFYRKREKRRVLYLYNRTLKDRKKSLQFLRRKVMLVARDNKLWMDEGLLDYLKFTFPKFGEFLDRIDIFKEFCFICGEGGKHFYQCDTPKCNSSYCQECWEFVENTCYACLPTSELNLLLLDEKNQSDLELPSKVAASDNEDDDY